ncbi:hypothetical protein ACI8AK_15470 [Geodermatophilus sp. SYSU D00867]
MSSTAATTSAAACTGRGSVPPGHSAGASPPASAIPAIPATSAPGSGPSARVPSHAAAAVAGTAVADRTSQAARSPGVQANPSTTAAQV